MKNILLALLQKLVGEFFFDFGEGNLAEFCGICSDPRNKGSKISGKISEHFCENILSLPLTSGIIMMALCHHGSSTGEKRVVSISITTIIITVID